MAEDDTYRRSFLVNTLLSLYPPFHGSPSFNRGWGAARETLRVEVQGSTSLPGPREMYRLVAGVARIPVLGDMWRNISALGDESEVTEGWRSAFEAVRQRIAAVYGPDPDLVALEAREEAGRAGRQRANLSESPHVALRVLSNTIIYVSGLMYAFEVEPFAQDSEDHHRLQRILTNGVIGLRRIWPHITKTDRGVVASLLARWCIDTGVPEAADALMSKYSVDAADDRLIALIDDDE